MSDVKVFVAGKQHEGLWPETVSLELKREDYICEGDRFVRFEDYARLKAEVEQLRKAGCWLYTELECFHRNEFCDHPDYEEERPSMKAWNAAKEGKPSV